MYIIRQDSSNFQLLTYVKFVNYSSSSHQSVGPLTVSSEDLPNLQKVVANTFKIRSQRVPSWFQLRNETFKIIGLFEILIMIALHSLF